MDERELIEFCRQRVPFNVLPESALMQLISGSRVKSYAAKESIFLEGAQGDVGYLVLAGRVAMVKTSPSGREMIVELLPAGELFGVVALIEQRSYPLAARAQSDVKVLVIPRSVISGVAQRAPEIFQGLLAIISSRLQSAHNVARALAHDKVEVRIASALLALVQHGQDIVDIGRQELADLTGTTIESASRVCKLWEREGVLDLTHQGIVRICDRSALSEIATI